MPAVAAFAFVRRHLIVCATAACLVGCAADAPSDSVRIGTSSVGSTFYAIAVAMSELAYRHAEINSTVQPVGGSVPNLFALDSGRLDMALVNAYAAYLAYTGSPPFEKSADIRLVLQGQRTFRHFLIRRGSGIESVADFAGRTIVAERPSNPDMLQIVQALLAVYGIPETSVRLISTSTSAEVMQAFEVGSIDAALFPFGEGAAIVEEALAKGLIELLQIPASTRDAALQALPPAIAGRTIPAGTFTGQREDINTFTMNAYLVANADVDEALVSGLVSVLLDRHSEFVEFQGAAREWTVERTLENAPLPYHPGTVRYLQSAGLWDDSLEARQENLLPGAPGPASR
jgi:TRAP transporter TAXI family solute receptor